MDLRFGLIHMAGTEQIMARQRDGYRPTSGEAPPCRFGLDRLKGEAGTARVSRYASGWRGLLGIAAVRRLLPARRQL